MDVRIAHLEEPFAHTWGPRSHRSHCSQHYTLRVHHRSPYILRSRRRPSHYASADCRIGSHRLQRYNWGPFEARADSVAVRMPDNGLRRAVVSTRLPGFSSGHGILDGHSHTAPLSELCSSSQWDVGTTRLNDRPAGFALAVPGLTQLGRLGPVHGGRKWSGSDSPGEAQAGRSSSARSSRESSHHALELGPGS